MLAVTSLAHDNDKSIHHMPAGNVILLKRRTAPFVVAELRGSEPTHLVGDRDPHVSRQTDQRPSYVLVLFANAASRLGWKASLPVMKTRLYQGAGSGLMRCET